MPADPSNGFQSVLSVFMEKFLQEKHACGYDYHEPTRILRRLDNFLVEEGLTAYELPGSIARKWLAKKAHESAGTQRQRITLVRHFSRFLLRLGYSAYVPRFHISCTKHIDFCPKNASRRRASQVLSGSGQA
jgi:site-specific recombinase XerD